jgi:hypothetical protein
MDRPAGAYIVKENGDIVPDPNDEAMVARHGLKNKEPKTKNKEQRTKNEEQGTEEKDG